MRLSFYSGLAVALGAASSARASKAIDEEMDDYTLAQLEA